MKRFMLVGILVIIAGMVLVQCGSYQKTGAKVYLQKQEYDKAKKQLIAAIEVNPDDWEAHFLLGHDIYRMEENYEKMMEHFNESLKYSNKKRGDIENDRRTTFNRVYNQGARDLRKGQESEDEEIRKAAFESTIKLMETALIIREDLRAIGSIGVSYLGLGQEDVAEKYFLEVLEKDPQDRNCLTQMGNLKFSQASALESELFSEEDSLKVAEKKEEMQELYKEAIYYYSNLVDYYPEEFTLVITNFAICYDRLGQLDEVLKIYERALADDPENNDFIIQMGIVKFKMGDIDDAVEEFKKALEKDPDNVNLVKSVAISLWEKAYEEKIYKGEMLTIEEATTTLPYLERVVELDDTDFDMWNAIAIIYAQLAQQEVTGAEVKMLAAFDIFGLIGEVYAGTAGAEEKLKEAKEKWKEIIKKEK